MKVCDLISREALLERFETIKNNPNNKLHEVVFLDGAMSVIDAAPAVDAEPVRHARWEEDIVTDYNAYPVYSYRSGYRCTLCGRLERTNKEPYCHCGAKMDLKLDKEEDDVRKTEKRDQ